MSESFLLNLPLVGCLGLLAGAAFADLTSYRIPNRLTGAIAALYPAHLLLNPAIFDIRALLVAGAVLIVGFGLFAWGKLGGGDAKLLAAASLWVGAADTPAFLLVTVFAGGALALLTIGPHRFLLARLAGILGGRELQAGLLDRQLPYGVAIATGGLVVLLPRLFA